MLAVREELLHLAPGEGLGWGCARGARLQLGRFRYRYDLPVFGEPEGADVFRPLPR